MFNNLFKNHLLSHSHPQKQSLLNPISFLLQEETKKPDLLDTVEDNKDQLVDTMQDNKDLLDTMQDNKDLLDTVEDNKDLLVTVEETEELHPLAVLAMLSLDSAPNLEDFTLLS
jgi:hypothetical protein